MGISSGRITNLKQSILETFDIYGEKASYIKAFIICLWICHIQTWKYLKISPLPPLKLV